MESENFDVSVTQKLEAADESLRQAIALCLFTGHAAQIESISDALVAVASAKVYCGKPAEYFAPVNDYDDEDDE